jgi:hypothetical protein
MTGPLIYGDDFVRRVLANAATIAVVGASSKPMRRPTASRLTCSRAATGRSR